MKAHSRGRLCHISMVATKISPLNPRRRILIFTGILILWVAAICGRLIYLQIFCYGDFVQRAARQQQRTIEVFPRRGVIYDRSGRPLAMSIAVDSIFAVPSEIPDQATTASLLARILKDDPHEILARMKSSHAFCWIARKVENDVAARIRALNLKGIYFQKESKRFYPKRDLAAQTLGYVGLDDEGLGGIERAYNARLRGKPGAMLISLDARRKWFGRVERQPDAGENLVLTIDQNIQYIAESELDAAMSSTHALAGTVIVQNPRTGEILALANRPTFNPNWFQKSSAQALNNRAVSDIYEPGSTFKIVTIAAALEEKLAKPEDVIDCQMGAIYIGKTRIRDHKAYGDLTVAQILANSSDVGAIKLALRLGDERFDHYIRAFGFGKQTGIELPGETRGIAKPVARWSKVSIGAIAMGQEIGISGVQLISLISTIANDGVYNAPRLVAGATDAGADQDGRLQKIMFHPANEHRVISTLTAAEMKKMMEGVVLFGTGKKAILNGYTSAGKTGTAQKADPATGRYSRTQYIASFAGFAPVNNPALSIAVILDAPVGPHEGGLVAAPVFARIAQQTLGYMNVSRDAEINDKRRLLLRAAASASERDVAEASPDRLGEELELSENASAATEPARPTGLQSPAPKLIQTATKASCRDAACNVSRKMSNRDVASYVSTDEPVIPEHGTVIVDVGSATVVPSFVGLPLRAALETAEQAGIELDVVGSGVAQEQSPSAGSHIASGSHVEVRFAR